MTKILKEKWTTINGAALDPWMYGTAWKEAQTQALTEMAIQHGFRAIDTANQRKHYHEVGVGEALQELYATSEITRGDLFLQTKFTYQRGQDHRLPYDPSASYALQVEHSFSSSQEHLHTSMIDSYVLHGPSTGQGLGDADWEVWESMESLVDRGDVRFLGVSNINSTQLKLLIDRASITPSFVQNRCYATTSWDKEIRDLCDQHSIIYQGFSLWTANRLIKDHPFFRALCDQYKKTAPQIIFRFAIQSGFIPLTGTSSSRHMTEDLETLHFELTADELNRIERLLSRQEQRR
jgi:diketogulonate reductase-like aldo/keto reductase